MFPFSTFVEDHWHTSMVCYFGCTIFIILKTEYKSMNRWEDSNGLKGAKTRGAQLVLSQIHNTLENVNSFLITKSDQEPNGSESGVREKSRKKKLQMIQETFIGG